MSSSRQQPAGLRIPPDNLHTAVFAPAKALPRGGQYQSDTRRSRDGPMTLGHWPNRLGESLDEGQCEMDGHLSLRLLNRLYRRVSVCLVAPQ